MQIVYRDADRTPLLYVIQEMAAAHEELMVAVDQVSDGDAYEQGFLQVTRPQRTRRRDHDADERRIASRTAECRGLRP